ncbi:sigma-70 family RNA polymerase sigma factor [Methylomonas paludis]|uniref:Sigma-70 family RNA polymerase sigma factor n=1 Tax=Methylomonas paludis TaxID=1173101 RepID=A0A975MPU7_9GAMM|nr:sigma-70 family RNA polymerase sigma factor [Methylomonas paludis]QWF71595.1 sigma-70 family RNA polymerase sigma factor [Methylomonas paludis]
MTIAITGQMLAEQRPVLFRYALLQLQDQASAEDAVQETLLAALQSAGDFAGKSSLRTWLISILKYKIADHWRRNQNEEPLPAYAGNDHDADSAADDDFFLEDGHWTNPPQTWADPEAAFKQLEFWAIYEICQQNLPPLMAKVFMLRELVGLEAAEICQETALTEANYWVTMHRARLRLRECLEKRWFNPQEKNHA